MLLGEIGRLRATCVHTDLRGRKQHFRFIEDVAETEANGWPALLFTPPTFLVDEIAAKRILDIAPDALALSSLEQRVYGWARAFVGLDRSRSWSLTLERAHALAGSEDSLRGFARALAEVVTADRLPDYTLSREGAMRPRRLRIAPRPLPPPDPCTASSAIDDLII